MFKQAWQNRARFRGNQGEKRWERLLDGRGLHGKGLLFFLWSRNSWSFFMPLVTRLLEPAKPTAGKAIESL